MNTGNDASVDHAKGFLAMRKRIVFKNAIYHVTKRAPGREQIFIEDSDYLYFLKVLKASSTEFKLNIFAFALLPNHIHLLLQILDENLSIAMKNIFERYAKYFNKKYKRKGHVFCGRFWASLCADDAYFISVSEYIHLNPLRAGLCSGIKDYRWSSIHLYLDEPRETFIVFDKLLLMLNSDMTIAREQYLKILVNGAGQETNLLIEHRVIHKMIISRINAVKESLFIKPAENAVADVETLIKELKCSEGEMDMSKRATRTYVLEQLRANGYSMNEISDMLKISRSTLYRLTKK